MPWRSQANLIQAKCHLDALLGRLQCPSNEQGSTRTTAEPQQHQSHQLRFDTAGVIIDGVLPIHPPVIAGAEEKVHTKE